MRTRRATCNPNPNPNPSPNLDPYCYQAGDVRKVLKKASADLGAEATLEGVV